MDSFGTGSSSSNAKLSGAMSMDVDLSISECQLDVYCNEKVRYVVFYNEIYEIEMDCIRRTFNPNEKDIVMNTSYSHIIDHLKPKQKDVDDAYDALVVFILAHATKMSLLLGQDESVTYDFYRDLIGQLMTNDSMDGFVKKFVGKPKIFVVQTCTKTLKPKKAAADLLPDHIRLLPLFADLFFAFSSVPGTEEEAVTDASYSFVKKLCELVSDPSAIGQDIDTLMTRLRLEQLQIGQPLSISFSTLLKSFNFNL